MLRKAPAIAAACSGSSFFSCSSGAEDLVNRELADITAVITAEDDQVMKGEGRLANYLERYKNSVLDTDSPVQETEFYTEENALHGMYSQNTINDIIKRCWGTAAAQAEAI